MLNFTSTTSGGDVQEDGSGQIFADDAGNVVLFTTTVSGSGVGTLQTSSIGGFAGVLLALFFGTSILVGYYVDDQGVQHAAPFTYTVQTADVRIGSQLYTGVALSTNSVAPEHAPLVMDYAGGAAIPDDAADESM